MTKTNKAKGIDPSQLYETTVKGSNKQKKGGTTVGKTGKGKKKSSPHHGKSSSEESGDEENEDIKFEYAASISPSLYCIFNEYLPSWSDEDHSWSLISAITDNSVIKEGLFPSPGSNVPTSKGGGKPKTDHQYALAVALFSMHPKYANAFGLAAGPKDRSVCSQYR
jgi:hypothetical protein